MITIQEETSTQIPAPDEAKERTMPSGILPIAMSGLLLLLIGIIYYPTFIWMWQRWFAPDSYFAHGPLVPVISCVLVWLKRRKLTQISLSSSRLGIVFLVAGLLLHIVSALTRLYFSSAYSLFFVLLGLILFLLGREITLTILFPLCFLLFMIPAPLAIMAATMLKMKLFVAHISASIIQFIGISIIREGSMVYMPNVSTIVGDPCSGLRSAISLSALGSLYAYIVSSSYPKKFLLFLSSIPIAILVNVIRTTAILLIANSHGDEIITNKILHSGFGLMAFVIAFIALFLVGRMLGCQLSQSDI